MPKIGLRENFELTTRNQYTKVACEIGMTVDGRELPNMAVLGKALEDAIMLIQERVTESYKVVPERVPPLSTDTTVTVPPTPGTFADTNTP